MKPDGVATTPAEPADDVVEPVPEAAASEEQVQQDSSPSSPQPEKSENEGVQENEASATVPPPRKEVNGKFSKPKDNTKASVKPKPGTAGTKATSTTSTASRPATAQSRVANGVMKTASNGASKKPASMTSEMKKKSAPIGASTQVKKVPTATTVPPRTLVKAAERKAVGSARPVPSTSTGERKTLAATSSTLSKKPVAGVSSAAFKPKSTVPRPITAPAAKASISASSKAAPVPKRTRPTVATASCPTTSSAPVRQTTTGSKSTVLRTTASAVNSASSQPTKVSTTVAANKDIKATTSVTARKPLASTTTRSTATKVSKPEPPKPGTAAKRLPTDTKTSQPKLKETRQVPTRKVPPSPRNISSRPAPGRMTAELSSHKQGVSNNLISVKRQPTKPMQSVLPLVIKEKPSEERSAVPVEPSTILETTAAIASVESVTEAQTSSVELAQPNQQTSALVEGHGEGVQVPVSEPTTMDTASTVTIDAEPLAIQSVANVPVPVISNPPTVVSESEQVHDYIVVVAPMPQEMTEQPEPVTASLYESSFTAQVPAKDLEVVEKQEQIICNLEEDEEREGSQQVSLSEMSGTQPTEESRPGSAGLAGSVWRAGGLPSEFDSEDVSCSQQGASELSAPGVLEGTESMDDLGEASLKGADGEGASAGSPDFEKFPDIPVNEDDDDDDEDRVDDMEVGSEMTEDPYRQCNDNEDEDEDVEMASEGVTESGLESYGNADEDDFAEDYRLDNLNRMQPSSIVPTALSGANPFGDAWMQTTLVSSPSSNPWQTYSELPSQPAAQACLDIGSAKTDLSSPQSAPAMDPVLSSPQPLELAPEMDLGVKQGFVSHSPCISQSSTLLGTELAIHTCSDANTPEELKDYRISPGLENQKQPLPVSLIAVALPDIMQDLVVCRSDRARSELEEEEPETLPADDMLAGLSAVMTSAPSSHSSATGDEASDTEGDMQVSDPTEPCFTGNECFDSTQVVHSMSALVEECEEACVEMEGGGGSDTPQSATSAASYGYECTNSNAQSTTESCIKSPGIFSLENEEQLPDEAKDPSLIKELNLAPAGAPADANLLDQQGELQLNSEQQYMLCGKVTEELPEPCSPRGTVPTETGLDSSSSSEHQKDLDRDAPYPYYSTICEKTDSFLTGSDLCAQQQEKVPTVHVTRTSKHHSGLCVDHVTCLPIDLPPRMPNVGCNAQFCWLEHQQQLEEIEQQRAQQSRRARVQWEEREEGKKEEKSRVEGELEQNNREEKERELEEQRRDLLHLQIQQQQQELKQRQQIMQWQQELEQQKEQSKQQNSHQNNLTSVLLSPSGLCTIYEALETSDAEEDFEDQMEEQEMVLKIKVEHACSPKERSSILEAGSSSDNPDSPQTQSTSSNLIQDNEGLTDLVSVDSPPFSGSSSSQQPSPLELDWSKKADIVQQLINQTLLLNGDNCSTLLLLPDGAAGTLSPLETSLWPNLPPLTPPSATVTSVSSFSAEISGSSPQGEWTVVELETHH